MAFAKSQMAAGFHLPLEGGVFISVHDVHKDKIVPIAGLFRDMGFHLMATRGTAAHLEKHRIEAEVILKVSEGRPHVVDRIKNGEIQVVINTSVGRRSTLDAYHIRRGALVYNVLYTTTLAGARALSEALMTLKKETWDVFALQDYHKQAMGSET
jgi:carbamoyl-phosphate synthase large subunit